MFFRITIPALNEGAKEDYESFVKDIVFPNLSGTPGLISLTSNSTGKNSVLNMAAWESKESVYSQDDKFQKTMAEAAQFFAAPPQIFEGDAVFGKVYQSIGMDEKKAGYMRLVIGVAKDTEAALDNLKENVEPIYNESEGLQITGASFDEDTLISWNVWDSQEHMNAALSKLQGVLDLGSQRDLFDGETIAYMGPISAGRLFVDFNEGETPA